MDSLRMHSSPVPLGASGNIYVLSLSAGVTGFLKSGAWYLIKRTKKRYFDMYHHYLGESRLNCLWVAAGRGVFVGIPVRPVVWGITGWRYSPLPLSMCLIKQEVAASRSLQR